MKGKIMKRILRFLPVFALLAGVFGVAATKSDSIRADAAWNDETVRIYLDKTATIAGLSWWSTDDTYIHIWDGTTNTNAKMTKVNDNLFYYDILDPTWDLFTDGTRGVEFYVYDQSSNQNQTYFTDGLYLKTNELNYFKLDSAYGSAKQSYVIQNKEVEEVIADILTLTCSSTQLQVQTVVDKYDALRAQGKTNLNTWEVDAGVTWYERLEMYADSVGATFSGSSLNFAILPQTNNIALISFIGLMGITAIAGFYFLKTKKQ